MVKRSRGPVRNRRSYKRQKALSLVGKRRKSARNRGYGMSSLKSNRRAGSSVLGFTAVGDGPVFRPKKYKVPKVNLSFANKVNQSLSMPQILKTEEVTRASLTRGACQYINWCVGNRADLLKLTDDASYALSGTSSSGNMLTTVIQRSHTYEISNTTASCDIIYDACFYVPRFDTASSLTDLMTASATTYLTGGDWQNAGFDKANFTLTDPNFNLFDCRDALSTYLVTKRVQGRIRPGKTVTFAVDMKPCTYDFYRQYYTQLAEYNSKHTFGCCVKLTGELSFSNKADSTGSHNIAQTGCHYLTRVIELRHFKGWSSAANAQPHVQRSVKGIDPAHVIDTQCIAINDEGDQVAVINAADDLTNIF